MTTAVVFHGNAEAEARFREALPQGSVIVTIRLEGGPNAYVSLASRFPTLESFMDAHAPSWTRGEPLVLLSFSAGTWALRHYLRDPAARSVVTAVVVVDGLYGGAPCDLAAFDGVLAFAEEANLAPNQKRLVITYSFATPAPAACTVAIEEIAGGPGLIVASDHETTHEAQLTEVAPRAVAQFVTPWIGSSSRPKRTRTGKLIVVGGVIAAIGYGVLRLLR